jgi:hypothetical protein
MDERHRVCVNDPRFVELHIIYARESFRLIKVGSLKSARNRQSLRSSQKLPELETRLTTAIQPRHLFGKQSAKLLLLVRC